MKWLETVTTFHFLVTSTSRWSTTDGHVIFTDNNSLPFLFVRYVLSTDLNLVCNFNIKYDQNEIAIIYSKSHSFA